MATSRGMLTLALRVWLTQQGVILLLMHPWVPPLCPVSATDHGGHPRSRALPSTSLFSQGVFTPAWVYLFPSQFPAGGLKFFPGREQGDPSSSMIAALSLPLSQLWICPICPRMSREAGSALSHRDSVLGVTAPGCVHGATPGQAPTGRGCGSLWG